ncbi:N-acetylmuramoyl-L-alanine amidase [Peribacillus asahii]|uniref:N-acetylmuramoyl-L-alanine amidase n=1 Tax=Peribacillus asahii TaxID=228899 RepID=UPI00207ABFF4|nr:N-acetylmuramoyl-L-alanine amidase [Peribacillus asahii]USK59448.1 N-acetylmuramoyl-L-alanine amidase [Peribacillus asahii]
MTNYTKILICILTFMLICSGFPVLSHAETIQSSSEKAIVLSKNEELVPVLKEETANSGILTSIPNQSEVYVLHTGTSYTYISFTDPLTDEELTGYIQNSLISAPETAAPDSTDTKTAMLLNKEPLDSALEETRTPDETASSETKTKSKSLAAEQQTESEVTAEHEKVPSSSESETIKAPAPTMRGLVVQDSTDVYAQAEDNADVLKSYPEGSILKYASFNNDWYICKIYVSGAATTAFIKKDDVETLDSEQTNLTGIATNTLAVYSKATTNSKTLKSYAQGSVLKYRTFASGWYEATVYSSGAAVTGYIRTKDVENRVTPQESLNGVAPTKISVYAKASTSSKKLKSYASGTTLKYKTFASEWYEATVYISGVATKGYIKKSDMEEKGTTYYVYGAASLNIRTGAGTSYSIVTAVKKGQAVTLFETKGNWGRIETSSGITGWASLSYLTKTKPSQGLENRVIVIDAGHGGKDPGAYYIEKNLTLQTAKQLQTLLKKAGAKVIMTRSTDTYLTLAQRVVVSHNNKADAFVSLHYNSSSSSSAKGIETFYWATNVNEKTLAQYVQGEVVKQTGLSNRGVRTGNFHVIRENKKPAILIELGFLSNATERKKVSTETYQYKSAIGIYKGLEKYFD